MKHIVNIVLLSIAIKSAECKVACNYLSYDFGEYILNKCQCIDYFNYYNVTNNKPITLGKKPVINSVGNHGYIPPTKEPEKIDLRWLDNIGEYKPEEIY